MKKLLQKISATWDKHPIICSYIAITIVSAVASKLGEGSVKYTRQYADISPPPADTFPEIRSYPSPFMPENNQGKEFILTFFENRYATREREERALRFVDYGFDGNLDRVNIEQEGRREVTITNLEELVKWQPTFEKLRKEKFKL